jgi:hypothetical protein
MSKKTRFSDHFGLGKAQSQLDFVDIPVETDIPLFVDPYALHISSQDWLRECGNSVVEYFQTLIDQIRKGKKSRLWSCSTTFTSPMRHIWGSRHLDPRDEGGDRGIGFIECHHTKPVSMLDGESRTHIDDLAMVCSNCHRTIHRTRPWLSIGELKSLLKVGSRGQAMACSLSLP